MDDPEHPTHTHRGGRGDPYPCLGGGALRPGTYMKPAHGRQTMFFGQPWEAKLSGRKAIFRGYLGQSRLV